MTRAVAKDEAEGRERYALHLAFATVARYRESKTGDRGDLLSAALMGAAMALARYDPTRGTKFSSFAISYIRGCIANEFRFWDTLPRKEREKVTAGALEQEDGLLPIYGRDVVQDRKTDVEREALARLDAATWRYLIGKLPAREGAAITMMFYEGLTEDEAGRRLAVGGTRIHQIVKQAKARLKLMVIGYGLEPEES
jgi:RNA polymerase sigma factor (sigma-70 family)